MIVSKPRIRGNFIAAHGDHGHGFGAASDSDFCAASDDPFGGERDGLQAGGTETVDGHRGDSDRQARPERSDARYVHALLGFGGLEAFGAADGFFDRGGGQIVGASGAQSAAAGFANGGAHGANDDGFT